MSTVEKFTSVLRVAVPGSTGAVFALMDVAFQVREKEAGGRKGGVGGAVMGVVLALRHLPAGRPTLHLLGNVWQELQQVVCRNVAFDDRTATETCTGPGGVLADAVNARVGGGAGGEEDAGVDKLKLVRTKVSDVGAPLFLSTMLATFVDGCN